MDATLVAMMVVVLLGSTVQSTVGFGSMLVGTVAGAQLLPPDQLVPLLLPIGLLQTAVVVGRTWRDVDVRLLGLRVLPAMGVGMAVAALGPGVAAPGMRPVLGVLVLALAAKELFRRGEARPLPWWGSSLVLVGAGVVQALLATGGPLVVWAIGRDPIPPARLRSTLNALWLVVNLVLGAALVRADRLNAETLLQSTALVPAALVGVPLGMWLHHRVDERSFRRALWIVLAVCGLPLILA
ncbi:MAG: sulfite exporter TauE/SafE family protein [Alphaproteobacteria bacterium]|nr:sulfite exporter TauE/SafE family protein [Alphaproteobacteria bacterium]MCB9696699.1 sulfite exporter TauE/SafE family protein [Alphaproteobacteria bacterium]